MNTTPTIPAETANHVLFHFGRGGYEAGNFTQLLIAAICAADLDNKAKLAHVYPDYAHAVLAMQYDPDGAAYLQAQAQPRCYRCGDKDAGPWVTRGTDTLCEACAAPQPFTGGAA
jgi:hypothetical protein